MVNEERLRHMIKLSQFDKNDDKSCKPMAQYARRDYVSLHLLGSFAAGSVSYVLLFGLWVLYSLEDLFEAINKMEIRQIAAVLVLSYAVFLLFYLSASYVIYNVKYTNGRGKVKKYYLSLKKVNQMYEREERLKNINSREWE